MTRFSLLTIILIVLAVSCTKTPEEPEWNNPTDPDMPGVYVKPETEIKAGPSEAETVNSHTVTFEFGGNSYIVQYAWKLDENDWSDWSADSSVTLSYLDEGGHEFQVKGRYNTKEEDDTPAIRSFIVDAVQGPALMFVPRRIRVALNTVAEVDIKAEEVENLAGVFIEIPLSSNIEYIACEVYDSGADFFSTQCNNFLSVVDPRNQALRVSAGRISQTLPGVDGSGAIMHLKFKYKGTTNSVLSFSSNCELENPDMQTISLNALVDCIIEVAE
jgi:hypothetical protein